VEHTGASRLATLSAGLALAAPLTTTKLAKLGRLMKALEKTMWCGRPKPSMAFRR